MTFLGAAAFTLLASLSTDIAVAGTFPDGNDEALKGLQAVDAFGFIRVSFDDEGGINDERFTETLTESFQLQLRRDGMTVTDAAPNYLICEVNIIRAFETYTMTTRVKFFDWAEGDSLNTLLWVTGRNGRSGTNKMDAEELGKDCADMFAVEWLKQNPK